MRAVTITRPGGPDVLAITELPMPEPGSHDVLVEVAAAGLNRADLLQRMGHYPAPAGVPAAIPGLEFAGTVAAVGAAVTRWQPGDRVFGLVGGAAQADFLVTDATLLAEVPSTMDLVTAAAVPEVFIGT